MWFHNFFKQISTDLHNYCFLWLHLQVQNFSNCWMHKYDQSFYPILYFNFWLVFVIWNYCDEQLSAQQKTTTKGKTQQIFWLKIRRALCDWSDKCLLTMAWQVFSLAMLNSSHSIYKTEVCWEKVRADIFENCNQKCQEGVRS